MKQYERELETLDPTEKRETMALISNAKREGIEQGRQEGRQEGIEQGRQEGIEQGRHELLTLLLRQRFTTIPATLQERLNQLTADQLNEFGKALFDFHGLDDVEQWFSQH